MKKIVFSLLLMAVAFQGYSKNTLRQESQMETSAVVVQEFHPFFDDCRITMRASIGFITVEVSVSAPTCKGAFNEATAALREAVASARDALR